MALLRAHRAGAVCVLGSATPSLASEALAREGKLEKLELPERAHRAAVLPAVEIVDLRRVGTGPTGDRLISLRLFREIERVLEAREQAILFLNRRGFSPSILCEECGKSWECPNCSVALTFHRTRGEKLVCHYCDFTSALPSVCDVCKSDRLTQEGAGTERIEQALAQAFPSARVARLDRDVAAGAKSARVLERMRRGEVDILVGTQMVTKGHDLPSVTLVGVLNADAALSMPDFRAAERTFHLVVQVAGRAGRGDAPGIVMIQTRQPDHPAIAFAARHDVRGFIESEMRDRRELAYPPFARIALVRVDGVDETRARDQAQRLARVASSVAANGVDVVGPAAAPLARLRNRWRFRFMVRSKDRQALRQTLLAVARAGHDRSTRVAIDVDPVSML
jgi:primosomal protein N' (replication factor Y)